MADDLDDFTAQLNKADDETPAGAAPGGAPPGMSPEQMAALKAAQEMKK